MHSCTAMDRRYKLYSRSSEEERGTGHVEPFLQPVPQYFSRSGTQAGQAVWPGAMTRLVQYQVLYIRITNPSRIQNPESERKRRTTNYASSRQNSYYFETAQCTVRISCDSESIFSQLSVIPRCPPFLVANASAICPATSADVSNLEKRSSARTDWRRKVHGCSGARSASRARRHRV
jgi:hypothetical protein